MQCTGGTQVGAFWFRECELFNNQSVQEEAEREVWRAESRRGGRCHLLGIILYIK